MMRNNADGIIEANDTIDQIQNKISEYKERIGNKQQRDAFNLFDVLENRIMTQNLSREEQFEKYMEEAKKAILKKLGDDVDMHEDSSKFEESKDSYNVEDDTSMAEFYSNMCPRTKMTSDSESSKAMIEEEDKDQDLDEYQRGSKKKKGKGRRK